MQENPTGIAVVAVAMLDGTGRVLLQRRPPGRRHAGLWEFPGGKVETGETRRAALLREIEEELGIRLDAGDLIAVGESVDSRVGPDRDPHVLFLYTARQWSGAPRASEGAEIGWFTAAEARSLAVPPLDRPLIDALPALLSETGGNGR